MNMTNQNPNQPTEMETKAKIIGRKLKQLKQKCADDTEKQTISIDGIVMIMEFTAEQLATDHRHLFQDLFIGHLEIFSELLQSNENQTDELTAKFTEITKMLCEMLTNKHLPAKYLCGLLTKWQQCLERIPCESKNHIFREIEHGLRQNCGRFLIEATCYSMQMQMLDIIHSYLSGEHLKGDDVTMKSLQFLKVFSGLVHKYDNTELVNAAVKMIEAKNTQSIFNEKHHVLDLLNGFMENRSIYSMPIKSLKSKSAGKTTHEYDSGWMHLNTVSGTVEFSVSKNGEMKTMHIKPHKLRKIEIIEFAEIPSLEVEFILNSKPNHEVEQEKTNESSKCIEVVMAAECIKNELIARLGQVFPAVDLKDIQRDPNNNSSDVTSKQSDAASLCFKAEHTDKTQKSARNEVPIRQIATLAKDSSFYGDDKNAVIDLLSGSKGVARSKDSTFYGDPYNVKGVQSNLISSTRKRPATGQSTKKVVKSIDDDKMRVYDFDASDEELVAKKPRGRGRGRPPARPQKRAKPAAFPRVKLPSVERREKQFTVRAKTPVGPSAKALNTTMNFTTNQMPPVAKKRAQRQQRSSTYATAITSGMDKLGAAVKTNLLVRHQQPIGTKVSPKKTDHDPNATKNDELATGGSLNGDHQIGDGQTTANDLIDVIDMGVDMGIDVDTGNMDTNANNVRCRCHDENLKLTLIKIRNSADRAIYIMQTCCCNDANTSDHQSNE